MGIRAAAVGVLLAVALAGCGGSAAEGDDAPSQASASGEALGLRGPGGDNDPDAILCNRFSERYRGSWWKMGEFVGQDLVDTCMKLYNAKLVGECLVSTRGSCPSADLAGADLRGASMGEMNLSGAALSEANLAGADLSRANLSGADLAGANLRGARMGGINLSGADLAGADLSSAFMTSANLNNANLANANFTGAQMYGVNLRGAMIDGANFSGANFHDAIWVDGRKCARNSPPGQCT